MLATKGMRFPIDVILVCVRWYAASALSARRLEDMMQERGAQVDHSSISRWAKRFLPLLDNEPLRTRKKPGETVRVDETYLKVKGVWQYLYRAVDKRGTTVDFLLLPQRDKALATRFLGQATQAKKRATTATKPTTPARSQPAIPAAAPEPKRKCLQAPDSVRIGMALTHLLRKGQLPQDAGGDPPARSSFAHWRPPASATPQGLVTAIKPLRHSAAPPQRDAAKPVSPSRKRATLARLLKESRKAFSEKGLAGARVEDIARAAGVTKQLVYHYFSTKEALFASVLDESAQDVLADLLALELDHMPPTQALRVLLEHTFDHFTTDPTLGALAQESFRLHEHNAGYQNRFAGLAPTLVNLMDRVLRRGAATGEFVQGVDARMFCAASAILTSGGFTSRYVVSTVAGFDTTGAEGVSAWRKYAVDFALATVLVVNPAAPR